MKPVLTVYAAGSLRYAFTELLDAFTACSGIQTEATFGPAGLLRRQIEQGAKVDLFASANRRHPQSLFEQGLARSTRPFINNSLCIVMRNSPELTSQSWLSALLDERFILGTSTPGSDPSGDYSLQLFDLIERLHPGAGKRLHEKARHLVGGEIHSTLPKNVLPAAYLIQSGKADLFIGYGNNAAQLSQFPDLHIIDIPAPYIIDVQYELCIMKSALREAETLSDFITSAQGRDCLIRRGFKALI